MVSVPLFFNLSCILFTSFPRSGATELDGEYLSTDFLATSKEWFFGGFFVSGMAHQLAFHAYNILDLVYLVNLTTLLCPLDDYSHSLNKLFHIECIIVV